MHLNPLVIAVLSAMLVACSSPQGAAQPASDAAKSAQITATAPAPTAAPKESAMGKRAAGDTTDAMTVFRAFGNEPFWNVNVEDDTLTFTTPEDQVGVVMHGVRRPLLDGIELTGIHDGTPFALKVAAGSCSDGMSDNTYQLVATFRFGALDYRGCGEAAK